MFRLHGPMASWGEVATGENRHSSDHPSKSAIIGLVSAALGVRRDAEDLHTKLTRSLGVACLVHVSGAPVEDFHTVQTPPQAELNRGSYFHTRRDELSIGPDRLYTVVSRREYRCDPWISVCLWQRRQDAPYRIEEIAAKLNNPVFTLYLGRKSCPPDFPLHAVVHSAPSILEAFRMDGWNPSEVIKGFTLPGEAMMFWDADGVAGIPARHIYQRRDEIRSRKRWVFQNRDEHFEVVTMPGTGGG